jgi:hypothetical protein
MVIIFNISIGINNNLLFASSPKIHMVITFHKITENIILFPKPYKMRISIIGSEIYVATTRLKR